MNHVLKPTRVQAHFNIGRPALYHEEHRGRRHVIIRSEERHDEEIGYFRLVAFADLGWEEYEVPVSGLEPCDDNFQPLAVSPADLRTPRGRGVDTVEVPGGRVYAPRPPERRTVVHPDKVQQVLDRYRPVEEVEASSVALDPALLTASQARRLDEANALLAAKGPGAPAKRREGRAALLALHHEVVADRTAAEVGQGLAESIRLAVRRGEQVDVKEGRTRMKTRDGLRSLYEAGKLTQRQYDEGMLYRAGAEARSADLGSCMGNEGPGAGHRHEQFIATRAERAFMLERNARIDRTVAMSPGHPSALQMLRSVAGEGHAITVWGKGSAYERHLKALRHALDVATSVPMRKPDTLILHQGAQALRAAGGRG